MDVLVKLSYSVPNFRHFPRKAFLVQSFPLGQLPLPQVRHLLPPLEINLAVIVQVADRVELCLVLALLLLLSLNCGFAVLHVNEELLKGKLAMGCSELALVEQFVFAAKLGHGGAGKPSAM